MTRAHRWPARGPAAPAHPGAPDPLAGMSQAIGDLAAAVRSLAPVVLDTRTVVLDANGQATETYRVPFAAVAVTSASVATLTITSGPPGAAAPGPSRGAGQVPPLGFAAHNISGRAWTLYGGNPNDQVTVSVFGRPVPPVAESGLISGTVTAAAFGQASTSKTGSVTGPAAGGQIVSTGPLGNGLYLLTWQLALRGTTAAADVNNMQLQIGAATFPALLPQTAGNPPVRQLDRYARITGGSVTINAIALATATAIYDAQLTATQVSA